MSSDHSKQGYFIKFKTGETLWRKCIETGEISNATSILIKATRGEWWWEPENGMLYTNAINEVNAKFKFDSKT